MNIVYVEMKRDFALFFVAFSLSKLWFYRQNKLVMKISNSILIQNFDLRGLG